MDNQPPPTGVSKSSLNLAMIYNNFVNNNNNSNNINNNNNMTAVINNYNLINNNMDHNYNMLTELDLFHKDMGVKEAIEIADMLRNNRAIKSVTIKSQNIENNGATAFANMLRVNDSLLELNLRSPGAIIVDLAAHRKDIEGPGGVAIGKALLENNRLTKLELDLSCNFIGDEGARAIAESLERNCTLQHINLSDNTRGAKSLFVAMRRSLSVNTLILKRNVIVADKSVTDTITESLKYNCSLTSIDLEGNRYPIPLTAFIDLLKWNNTLIDIKISGGDSKKQTMLEELIDKNKKFQENKRKWREGDGKPSGSFFISSKTGGLGSTSNAQMPAKSLSDANLGRKPRTGSMFVFSKSDKSSSLGGIFNKSTK